MKIPLAHGAGGGFDELLLLVAVFFLVFGIVRIADRTTTWSRRRLGIPMIVVALATGALPIVFRLSEPTPSATRIASTARVGFVSPQPGSTVTGSFVDVEVRLDGGKLEPAATRRLKPDVGHLHLYLDGRLYSMTEGTRQRIDLADRTAGEHLLRVEFVALDHGPFDPPVIAETRFVLEK